MPDTKPVGVAYSDPTLNGAVIDNSVIGGTTRAAANFNAVTATSVFSTGAVTAASGTAVAAGGSASLGLFVSSTVGLGVYFGSGAPTISAPQGSLYLRTDGSSTSTRLYVNTNGTTGWTNITSAT